MDLNRPNVWEPPGTEVATAAFYDRALQHLLELLQQVTGVESVYTFGSVRAPGNSDIDLMIVIEPEPEVAPRVLNLFEARLSPAEQFVLFQHDPMIIGRAVARKIQYVRPASNLQLVYGEPQAFDCEPDPLVRLYLLVDLITQYYPRTFFSRRRPIRLRFQHINALRFCLALLRECGQAFGFGGRFTPELPETTSLFAENDRMRIAHGRQACDDAQAFLTRAEAKAVRLCTAMIRELDAHLSATIGDSQHDAPVVIGDRIFANVYGADPWILVPLFVRRVRYWYYPHVYHRFFRAGLPPAHQNAVRERNSAVLAYCDFVDRYSLGRGLYRPWWTQPDRPALRLSRRIASGLAARRQRAGVK